MGIILSKNKEEIIKILRKQGDCLFTITKEVLYAIPKERVLTFSEYTDFLQFAKENPKEVFADYYEILSEIKEVKELPTNEQKKGGKKI